MNVCIFDGRLTMKPDLKSTSGGTEYARFSLAVDRYKKANEEQKTDFFNMVAFGKTAKTLETYCNTGDQIIVNCSAQCNEYTDKEGNSRKSVEFIVNSFSFGAKKQSKTKTESSAEPDYEYATGDEDDLPF